MNASTSHAGFAADVTHVVEGVLGGTVAGIVVELPLVVVVTPTLVVVVGATVVVVGATVVLVVEVDEVVLLDVVVATHGSGSDTSADFVAVWPSGHEPDTVIVMTPVNDPGTVEAAPTDPDGGTGLEYPSTE